MVVQWQLACCLSRQGLKSSLILGGPENVLGSRVVCLILTTPSSFDWSIKSIYSGMDA